MGKLLKIHSVATKIFREVSSVRNLRATIAILSIFALFIVISLMQQQIDIWQVENLEVNPQKKYILLYKVPQWMQLLDSDEDCVVTTRENLLPSITMFDAVVFSAENPVDFPPKRSPEQFYVFTSTISPLNSRWNFAKNAKFNLTMTYRRDSDVFWPNGYISDELGLDLRRFRKPNWRYPVVDRTDIKLSELNSIIAGKSKFSAVILPECSDKSQRMDLIAVMENYIEIDIYGDCGRLDCPNASIEECLKVAESEYFFLFVLENSLCRDYVTELLFKAMQHYVIPVVYGYVNYEDFLPPHSFIDVNSFNRTTDLAEFLIRLSSDSAEYSSYFWWKKFYPNVETKRNYKNLCRSIHEMSLSTERRETDTEF